MSRINKFVIRHYWHLITLAALLTIAGSIHGINMFHFPHYYHSEGIFISQAWSFLQSGKLDPYTYQYDQPPFGVILLALWFKISGFYTFGTTINAGRLLMLLAHLISSGLIYYITCKLTGRKIAAIMAILIFSISPLAIYFQRQVAVENLMISWILASGALLLKSPAKTGNLLLSALCFSIAVLTEFSAVYLLPAILLLVYQQYARKNALIHWSILMLTLITLYCLFTFLSGEFFPGGWFGTPTTQPSLLTGIYQQFFQRNQLPFWQPGSNLHTNFQSWMQKDWFFIYMTIINTVIAVIGSLWFKQLRVPTLALILYSVYLLPGSSESQIIPLIPLAAIVLGLTVDQLIIAISGNDKLVLNTSAVIITGFLIMVYLPTSKVHYYLDQTSQQTAAIEWIRQHAHPEDFIAIDGYAYVDLHQPRFTQDKVFPKADLFTKIYDDPQVYTKKYNQDWARIDYIMLSPYMLTHIEQGTQEFIRHGLDNSILAADISDNHQPVISTPYITGNSKNWMKIYQVTPPHHRPTDTLANSWQFYQEKFIELGRVIDPDRNNSTISEGQSYALLRAVYQDDQAAFDQIWNWTRTNLQVRKDSLFAWIWSQENGEFKVTDLGNATDGDLDIALALIFAANRWDNQVYLEHAKHIVDDIWEQTVTQVNGKFYLLPMAQAERPTGYLLNPSYFSPAHYRIFAQIDPNPDHHWNLLADDTYKILDEIAQIPGNSIKLPANWYVLDKQTGNLSSARPYLDDNRVDTYGYDAFRIIWRVALEHSWFHYPPAREYLEQVSPWFAGQWEQNQQIESVYTPSGTPLVDYQSISTTTAPIIALQITNSELSQQIYQQSLNQTYNLRGYWENPNAYYDQNWAWFTEAFYTGQFPNLAK